MAKKWLTAPCGVHQYRKPMRDCAICKQFLLEIHQEVVPPKRGVSHMKRPLEEDRPPPPRSSNPMVHLRSMTAKVVPIRPIPPRK